MKLSHSNRLSAAFALLGIIVLIVLIAYDSIRQGTEISALFTTYVAITQRR